MCAIACVGEQHSNKCTENVNKNGEVVKLVQFENKNDGENEQGKITKVERPLIKSSKSRKIITTGEVYHSRDAYINKRISFLLHLASCK